MQNYSVFINIVVEEIVYSSIEDVKPTARSRTRESCVLISLAL